MKTLQTAALVCGLSIASAALAAPPPEKVCDAYADSADKIVMARDFGMSKGDVVSEAQRKVKTDAEKAYFDEVIGVVYKNQGMYASSAKKMMHKRCMESLIPKLAGNDSEPEKAAPATAKAPEPKEEPKKEPKKKNTWW